MYFRPGTDDPHPPHSPFKAIVTPRPIGWISTIDVNGVANLAPYSFFNAISDDPPMVVFGSTGGKRDREIGKDTLSNILETGEFVVNIVSRALIDAMNVSSGSFPSDVDEFEMAGLEKAACQMVAVPRVAASPAALECKLWKTVPMPGGKNHAVFGQVVGIHIDDQYMENEMLNITAYEPVARLGYRDYAAIDQVFQLKRPGQK